MAAVSSHSVDFVVNIQNIGTSVWKSRRRWKKKHTLMFCKQMKESQSENKLDLWMSVTRIDFRIGQTFGSGLLRFSRWHDVPNVWNANMKFIDSHKRLTLLQWHFVFLSIRSLLLTHTPVWFVSNMHRFVCNICLWCNSNVQIRHLFITF